MKVFKRLRIIEAGQTANSFTQDGKEYKLIVSADCFPSLVALGNARPIHARRTHNGADLLDGYIGHFTNFEHDGSAVYADLVMSEALESAYPNEFAFMVAMIEKEPELIGVSVNQHDVKELNDEDGTATIVEVTELYSADLVGLPAATSSLFNSNINSSTMSKVFTALKSLFSASKFAENMVTTKDGKQLTIVSEGETIAIGDAVKDEDGNPVADGDYEVVSEDGAETIVIAVVGGVISEVKEYEAKTEEELADDQEEKPEDEKEEEKKTPTPEELAAIRNEVSGLKKEIKDLRTALSRKTGAPSIKPQGVTTSKQGGNETKLSREAVQKAAAEMRKKFK